MARAVEPLLFGHITWRELLGTVVGGIVDKVKSLSDASLSFADHIPTNYIVASQPASTNTEFGNDF